MKTDLHVWINSSNAYYLQICQTVDTTDPGSARRASKSPKCQECFVFVSKFCLSVSHLVIIYSQCNNSSILYILRCFLDVFRKRPLYHGKSSGTTWKEQVTLNDLFGVKRTKKFLTLRNERHAKLLSPFAHFKWLLSQ